MTSSGKSCAPQPRPRGRAAKPNKELPFPPTDGLRVVSPPARRIEPPADFAAEALDHVQRAETALLTLETHPADQQAVDAVLRAFHTIKGTAGFLPLPSVERLAQAAETMIENARRGTIQITGGYADLALESCDMLREIMKTVQEALPAGGTETAQVTAPAGYDDLVAKLTNPEAAGIDETPPDELSVVPRIGDILVAQGTITRDEVERVASQKGSMVLGHALLKSGALSAPEVAKALRAQKQLADIVSDSSVRVSAEKLDRLVRLIDGIAPLCKAVSDDDIRLPRCDCPWFDPPAGGLTTRSNVEGLPQSQSRPPKASGRGEAPCAVPQQLEGLRLRISHWQRSVGRLGRIARGLEDLALSMRMTPLKPAFLLMSRMARDLAHKSGKSVRFATDGAQEEIGRNRVEALSESLMHLIRNAVDHGIEPPMERLAAGKTRTGSVTVKAYRAGSDLILEVRDDGRGLDRAKILATARAKGLVPALRQAQGGEQRRTTDKQPNEKEVFGFIFLPGFSTAPEVTGISGRGVGLDAVKISMESIGGHIDVASIKGRNTTFTIRLPSRLQGGSLQTTT